MRQIIIFALLLSLVASCATSPTGRRQLLLMSDQEMDQMGQAAFDDIKSKQTLSKNNGYKDLVMCVSNQIIRYLPAPYNSRQWEIDIFEDVAPNAFALPGEKIGVHTGMINLVENADQLAAVIGHEIGHVIAKHSNERMSSDSMVQGGLAAVNTLFQGESTTKSTVMGLLGVGAQVGVILPFSRNQEAEADVYGQEVMAKAGFDPAAAVRLWQLMGQSGGQKPPEFMSTHPSSETRIKGLQTTLQKFRPLYVDAIKNGKPNCKKPRE